MLAVMFSNVFASISTTKSAAYVAFRLNINQNRYEHYNQEIPEFQIDPSIVLELLMVLVLLLVYINTCIFQAANFLDA